MLYAVDFELAPKEGQEASVSALTEDPILHWVGFHIEAKDPIRALEFGTDRLKQTAPEIGEMLHSLEASVEPM